MVNEQHKPKVLMIGPLPGARPSATDVIGGNKVLSAESVLALRGRGFELDVLDTSGSVTNLPPWKVGAIRLARFMRVLWGVVNTIRRCRLVFLVIAPYSALIAASPLWIICKIARRPLVLRFSGSGLGAIYRNYGALTRWLADRTWMRSALVYVETQQLHREFGNLANFRWFPNTRNVDAPAAGGRETVRKLVFMAQLHMDKGLAEALDACRCLPEHCHLHVFGPRMSDTDFSLFEGHPRATYGGVLGPAEVPHVLSEHDLLLFPSYCRYEGYPGAILEAFQCGLPVVAAKWGGVSELVEHEENGLLVEPRSVAALWAAIERVLEDPDLYRRLCGGARRRGGCFRSAEWYDRAAADLRGLCELASGDRTGR